MNTPLSSDEATAPAAANGRLYIVSAPSGAGKTSLLQRLLAELDDITLSISHTTRASRPGETDGVSYHFVTDEAFDTLVTEGAFLEHARVYGRAYGTARGPVVGVLERGGDVLLEVDWQGAQQVRAAWPACQSIFILPPSRDALRLRLGARGQDDQSVIELRMAEAEAQAGHYDEYDYVVVNDDFELALSELRAIFTADRLRLGRQQRRHRVLLTQLTGASA